MKKLLKLVHIEGKLVFRSIDAIFFGVLMPVGIMLLIGMICGDKPAFEGADYTFLQGSFGALLTIGICATAFMSIPLTIAGYREKKVLKHFFVTPVSPVMFLAAYGILFFMLSLVSAGLVSLTAIIFFGYRMQGMVLAFIGSWLLVLLSMYSIGFMIASVCRSVKTVNVVCSAVYFPMVFLSGATIPYEVFPKPLQAVADILPLSRGIKLLKACSLGESQEEILFEILILSVYIVVCLVISGKTFKWE